MSQMTLHLDDESEQAIEILMPFFGTVSRAAALRSALALARAFIPASKDGAVTVYDQNAGTDLTIVHR